MASLVHFRMPTMPSAREGSFHSSSEHTHGEVRNQRRRLSTRCPQGLCSHGGSSGRPACNSPIFETEVKGGACSVTLHLCRRALAGAIARGLWLVPALGGGPGCILCLLAVVFPSSVFSTRRSMGKLENRRPTDLSCTILCLIRCSPCAHLDQKERLSPSQHT